MITILVAFVGQTMGYHFMDSYDSNSESHTKIEHQIFVYDNDSASVSGNIEVSDKIDECCKVECCEIDCICPANACTSIAYLDNHLPLSKLVVIRELLLTLATKDTRFIANSLYRPPIFTS